MPKTPRGRERRRKHPIAWLDPVHRVLASAEASRLHWGLARKRGMLAVEQRESGLAVC